jgi:hypothetical protein
MVVMHSRGTVAALSRRLSDIDSKLKGLLESESKTSRDKPECLPNYFQMGDSELKSELSKFARLKVSEDDEAIRNYVLTPDNFLKIVMIYIRVDASLPVIVMGETGESFSNSFVSLLNFESYNRVWENVSHSICCTPARS